MSAAVWWPDYGPSTGMQAAINILGLGGDDNRERAIALLQPHASAAPAVAMIRKGAITQAIQWIREQREVGEG